MTSYERHKPPPDNPPPRRSGGKGCMASLFMHMPSQIRLFARDVLDARFWLWLKRTIYWRLAEMSACLRSCIFAEMQKLYFSHGCSPQSGCHLSAERSAMQRSADSKTVAFAPLGAACVATALVDSRANSPPDHRPRHVNFVRVDTPGGGFIIGGRHAWGGI